MRKSLTGLALLAVSFSYAQQKAIVADDRSNFFTVQKMAGAQYSSQKYVSFVSGDPFYRDAWLTGSIVTMDSLKLDKLLLKLDFIENVIIHKNEKNEEMVCTVPVKEVWLNDPVSGKDVEFVQLNKVLYQKLSDGPVILYKQYFKKIVESKSYASSVTEQSIISEEHYYVGLVTGLVRIKKPKDLASVFPGKASEINDYVSQKKLNGKKESDYIAIVDYYNTLNN